MTTIYHTNIIIEKAEMDVSHPVVCPSITCARPAVRLSVPEYLGPSVTWCVNGHVTVHDPEHTREPQVVFDFRNQPPIEE